MLNTTHGTHTRSLVAVAFTLMPIPTMHVVAAVQLVLMPTEKVSSGQSSHSRSDDAVGASDCISPAKQFVAAVHAVSVPVRVYVLRAQGKQMVCAIAVPGCATYSPGSQSSIGWQGPLCPASGCVCPNAHGVQGVDASPSRSVVPGAHSVPLQEIEPAGTYCPAPQRSHWWLVRLSAVPAAHGPHKRSDVAVGGTSSASLLAQGANSIQRRSEVDVGCSSSNSVVLQAV